MRLVGFLANSEDVSQTFVAHAVAASSTGEDPACERSHRVNVVPLLVLRWQGSH